MFFFEHAKLLLNHLNVPGASTFTDRLCALFTDYFKMGFDRLIDRERQERSDDWNMVSNLIDRLEASDAEMARMLRILLDDTTTL